jgi:hypothetical protein
MAAMRPAPDRTGSSIGPYPFVTLQRRGQGFPALLTVRWGFAEAEEADAAYVIPASLD